VGWDRTRDRVHPNPSTIVTILLAIPTIVLFVTAIAHAVFLARRARTR
jgi:Sec-independent protein secretion pathway component TatC